MNLYKPGHGIGRAALILLALVSVLSISAAYIFTGETLFLPVVFQQGTAPDPIATQPIAPQPTAPATAAATQTPEATPQLPKTLLLVVNPSNPDKDWALAFFAKSYNGAGRPVMQIYPGDTAPESERIKIPRGEIVLALETPVTADGGAKYWQLVEYQGRKGETLFLRAADVTKVTSDEPEG